MNREQISKLGFTILTLLLITACTSNSTPTSDATNSTISVTTQNTVVATGEATEESVPTSEVTVEATETVEATLEVTEEATAELTTLVAPNPTEVESGITPQEDVIVANVEEADRERGEDLYNETLIPACRTCHLSDTTVRQTAPSLVNFSDIAGTRVEGEGAYTYAYNSIRYANLHVVDGYSAGVMPVYDGILSDQDVYDLIAYIWTLSD